MKLLPVTREGFIKNISSDKGDGFAKTFVAKADMQKQWIKCIGAYNDKDELMGAIITTISKRIPRTANLQLLHTFVKFRGNGVGKFLTENSLEYSFFNGASYYRVSAEPDAVKFYEKCGFKFWGLQKGGCSLSIFKMTDGTAINGIYNDKDPVINKALYSGKKGSLASSWKMPAVLDI